MTLRRVDLPAPLLPITATNSPSAIVKSTPLRARRSLDAPGLNVFWTCCSRSMGRIHPPCHRREGGATPAKGGKLVLECRCGEGQDDEDRRDDLKVGGRKAASESDQDRHPVERSNPARRR